MPFLIDKTIIAFTSRHIENALKPFLGTEVIWENADKWLVCGIFTFPKMKAFWENYTFWGKLE